MSAVDLERIEGLLRDIKAELEKRGATPMPTLLTMKAAAVQLSVGITKLRELVAQHVVMTVPLGGREMVPASEIARLSQPERPKPALTAKAMRLAASLAKVREPVPGARAAVLKVRNAKNPHGVQDPAALRKRR